jgi:hypothetical protein
MWTTRATSSGGWRGRRKCGSSSWSSPLGDAGGQFGCDQIGSITTCVLVSAEHRKRFVVYVVAIPSPTR